ncbi:MAG: cell division protein FtsZ [Bacteroidales bacterium]|nr:cell division protein FtsZ [Bacteroidales bacterium]
MSEVEFDIPQKSDPNGYPIKVIGVGGGGGNAVNHLLSQNIRDVSLILCNTDSQVLEKSKVPTKIVLGATLTRGRGAGNDPEMGEKAAIESLPEIEEILKSTVTDMVFITAGMGGGTGTGAAPVIAKAAHDLGILTVAVVSFPDKIEGPKRFNQALKGIEKLRQHVDTLLVVNNEKIIDVYGDLDISNAFSKADEVLSTAVKGIADMINMPWEMNIDMADVKSSLRNSQVALMGIGIAQGENRIQEATNMALHSPLLNDNNISNARDLLIHIAYKNRVGIKEAKNSLNIVQMAAGGNANMIWGHGIDSTIENDEEVKITVIATGFNANSLLDRIQNGPTQKSELPPMPLFPNDTNISPADTTTKYGQFIAQDPTPAYKKLPFDEQLRLFDGSNSNNGIVSSPDDGL